MPKSSPGRGKLVVLVLVGLCLAACLGTYWTYARLHVSTVDAVAGLVDGTPVLIARFAKPAPLAPGQRATVSIGHGPSSISVVKEIDGDGRAVIPLPEGFIPVPGQPIEVTIETFLR